MTKFKKWKKAISMELREHKSSSMVYFVLRAIVIGVMIRQLFLGNYENAFLCILTMILFIMPSVLQLTFWIELPTTLEIIILLFIFSAEILGEIQLFYLRIPMWDTILHTLNGFLAAAIGFSMVELLNRNQNVPFALSPLYLSLVAFCFSMTIGVLWEFFECGMDMFLHFDMQKDTVLSSISSVMLDPTGQNIPVTIDNIESVVVNGQELGVGGYLDIGLRDTMKDLLVNFIGAAVFSTLGYFYVKNQGKKTVVNRFIPRRKRAGEDYLTLLEKNDMEK